MNLSDTPEYKHLTKLIAQQSHRTDTLEHRIASKEDAVAAIVHDNSVIRNQMAGITEEHQKLLKKSDIWNLVTPTVPQPKQRKDGGKQKE